MPEHQLWIRLFDGRCAHDCAGHMTFGSQSASCAGCGAEWVLEFKTNARGDPEPARWRRLGPLTIPESTFYPPDEPW